MFISLLLFAIGMIIAGICIGTCAFPKFKMRYRIISCLTLPIGLLFCYHGVSLSDEKANQTTLEILSKLEQNESIDDINYMQSKKAEEIAEVKKHFEDETQTSTEVIYTRQGSIYVKTDNDKHYEIKRSGSNLLDYKESEKYADK